MSIPGRERYHLIFEPIADDVPAIARLRRLLKAALRSYKLRCAAAWMEDEHGRPLPLPADGEHQHQHEEPHP